MEETQPLREGESIVNKKTSTTPVERTTKQELTTPRMNPRRTYAITPDDSIAMSVATSGGLGPPHEANEAEPKTPVRYPVATTSEAARDPSIGVLHSPSLLPKRTSAQYMLCSDAGICNCRLFVRDCEYFAGVYAGLFR